MRTRMALTSGTKLGPYEIQSPLGQYDASRDGQRFIINTRAEQSLEPITLYANWERELKK